FKKGTKLEACKIKPISLKRNCVRFSSETSLNLFPFIKTLPSEGCCNPPIIVNKVLFPDPLGPITATNSPASIEKFVFSKAIISWLPSVNVFEILFTSINFIKIPPSLSHQADQFLQLFEQRKMHLVSQTT